MKVYILQVHEDASRNADEIDVFGSLAEAAQAYNDTIKDINGIYGTDPEIEMSFLFPKEIAKYEGKDINEEYEVPDSGCSHVVSLYSRDI